MSQTTMSTDLLQPLKIVTKLAVDTVGQDLAVLAIHDIALTIKEPGRDLVLRGVLDDGDDPLELFGSEFTGAVGRRMLSANVITQDSSMLPSRPAPYRLLRSTSAFLQTRLEYRRPTPLILVRAYMTFSRPSTLVLRRRRMNWKFDFSPVTSAVGIIVISMHSQCRHAA